MIAVLFFYFTSLWQLEDGQNIGMYDHVLVFFRSVGASVGSVDGWRCCGPGCGIGRLTYFASLECRSVR